MTRALAAVVIPLAGIYLLSLAGVLLVAPARAVRFLGGFAASPRVHCLELSIRAAVGVALLLYSPHMELAGAFRVFGCVLTISTGVLFAVPWQWHRRFAQTAVPIATQYPRLLALCSRLVPSWYGRSPLDRDCA